MAEKLGHVMTDEEFEQQTGYKQELKRGLSVRDLIIYGLVFMVPIAPFGIYGEVFMDSRGMPSLVYLIGMVVMIFSALSYARLSEAFPVSGSVYGYTTRGVNRHLGFIAGWAIMLDYLLVPTLLYVVAAAGLSLIIPGVHPVVWGVMFIIINTIINYNGVELTARFNRVALVVELIILALFVFIGLWWVISAPESQGFTIKPFFQPEHIDVNFIMGAVSLAVLSFLGFDGISTLAEESKDGPKSVGRASVAALMIVGFLFMLQTYVAALIVPDPEQLLALSDGNLDQGFYTVAAVAGGQFLSFLTAMATAIAWGIVNSLAAQTAITRILYAMGRDGMVPRALAKVHPVHKTPYVATFLVAAISIVLVVLFTTYLDIATISRLVNFGALTSFVLLNFTVIWYFTVKQKSTDYLRHLIMPLIGLIFVLFVWINLEGLAKQVGLIWMAIGVVYYLILYFGFGRKDAELNV